jgi:hypothetical protein
MLNAIIIGLACLLVLAFIIRIGVGMWKIIYWAAPVVVPLLIIAYCLMVTGNLNLNMEVIYDTEHIGSVENQSRRSGNSNQRNYDKILSEIETGHQSIQD